jgi:hypothetical protein
MASLFVVLAEEVVLTLKFWAPHRFYIEIFSPVHMPISAADGVTEKSASDKMDNFVWGRNEINLMKLMSFQSI